MLICREFSASLPTLQKTVNGKDASLRGAFFCRDRLTFTFRVPRTLGAAAVVLRICPDGGADCDLPFDFIDSDRGVDTYRLRLSLSDLCSRAGEGLFYYEFLFVRGDDTLFTDTADNVTFSLLPHAARRFLLLISENNAHAPRRFHGGTMYHVFVDRFAPGRGERRADAVYHERWNEEIEQFPAFTGAPLANNEFFGGTLWGVLEKLDYLQSLGVDILYLSPVFRAYSNHKYDIGDYGTVDEQFGGREALAALLAECRARGIAVMLDGVFNHTGDDSLYFNKYGKYPALGAYQSVASPYHDWYFFTNFPDEYVSWWGIPILPKLNLGNPAVQKYLVGEGGIVDTYTKMGVSAWRLDVADELPDSFLDALAARVAADTNGEGVVLGEVWENAADKVSYGARRRYLRGRQLDSVMNYPFRTAVISFVRDGDAHALASTLRNLWGSYPVAVCHSLMNILSTHDTERILTVLGGESGAGLSNAQLRDKRLSPENRRKAIAKLRVAAALQYTVFGLPSLFYGDEAGMEGYHDPFCRRPYPWGREDQTLLAFYRTLGAMRRAHSAFCEGDFAVLRENDHALLFERRDEKERLWIAANCGENDFAVDFPGGNRPVELLSGEKAGKRAVIFPMSVRIWRIE